MSNATDPRHPDIEIYVADLSLKDALAWLQERFDSAVETRRKGQRSDITVQHQEETIPVMVIEQATGRYTSLWFNADTTPWRRDLECAQEAQQHFGREVRCIASGWQEGDDPDEWWSVTGEAPRKISWKSS